MDRYPVAYVRRSSADTDNPGDVSREAQETAIRELAHRDGHNGNLRVFTDWDRSADEAKEAKRTEYAAMLAEIATGRVSVVYAYALDRLYRSLGTFVRLRKAAQDHDVRIVTLREGVLMGDGSPMAKAFAGITAIFTEMELDTAKVRAKGAASARRRRGDHMGPTRYGYRLAKVDGVVTLVPDPDRPLAPVFAAYAEAGTMAGACRILNASGVPAPRGGLWRISTVTQILEDNGATLPARNARGHRRNPPAARFAQLLRCHCGRMLTPNQKRHAYYCSSGLLVKGHGRYYVAESAILPAIREEVGHLGLPVDAVALGDAPDLGAERAQVTAQRERLALAFARGGLPEETYTAEDDALRASIEKLGEREEAETVAPVSPIRPEEWDTWSPADLNAYVRAILRRVRLGADMRPLPFTPEDWRNPALRST